MEDTINQINGQVQVIFTKGEGTQIYRDAIWMPQEEYANTSIETIEAIKLERYTAWFDMVNAVPLDENP